MGIITSYMWGASGRTDDQDALTGLTSRDRYVIKTTWKKISEGQKNLETGMAIFLKLFEKHPQYHQLFPFRDMPREQLSESNMFRAHCISLMYAFTSFVGNIDSPLILVELLAKQGTNHVPRKVPDQAYWELEEVLLELFAISMDEADLKTWKKFLDFGFGVITERAENVRNNKTT